MLGRPHNSPKTQLAKTQLTETQLTENTMCCVLASSVSAKCGGGNARYD